VQRHRVRLKPDNKQVDVWSAISQRSDTRVTAVIDQLDPVSLTVISSLTLSIISVHLVSPGVDLTPRHALSRDRATFPPFVFVTAVQSAPFTA